MVRTERGFTLPEVLLTLVVIAIGLSAVMAAVPFGAFGVQEGRQLSTAAFLADQRLEQLRSVPWTGTPANDCLGLSATAAASPAVPAGASCSYGATNVGANGTLPWFTDEGPTAIAGFAGYSRQVRIDECGVGAVCDGIVDPELRVATVTVTYTPLAAGGAAPSPKSVTVSMLVSRR